MLGARFQLGWTCIQKIKFDQRQGRAQPRCGVKFTPGWNYTCNVPLSLTSDSFQPKLQNSENSYILKKLTKVMEFFFSKVAGYNITKKRLHERFLHAKFVRTCQNGYLLGQFLVNDSVFLGIYEILPVFSTQLRYFSNYT